MATLDSGIGSKWALALDGRGYLLSTLDQESPFEYRAYTIEPIPLRLPRIDNSSEPGEQSLGSLWPRAQHSWHEGAGQKVFDSEFSSRYKSEMILNLDPFEEKGYLSIGPEMSEQHSEGFIEIVVGSDNLIGIGTAIFYRYETKQDGTNTNVVINTPTAARKTHSVDVQGDLLYFWNSTLGIYTLPTDAIFTSATPTKVNDLTDGETLAFVKGRLMAGKGPSIHEIVDLTSTTDGATAHFTHLDTNWIWTCFSEGGPAIFAAGYSNERSQIYAMGFDASTAASGLTLDAPRVVWEAPHNEKIHSMAGYLGAAFLIGTSKGVRNAIITETGDIQVSPLIVETPDTCDKVVIGGDYGYFIWGRPTSEHEEKYGLGYYEMRSAFVGKIDLSNLGWALPYQYHEAAWGDLATRLGSIAIWDGDLVIADGFYNSNHRTVIEDQNGLVLESGLLFTGDIRFGTSETKLLRKMDVTISGENQALRVRGNDGVFLTSKSGGRNLSESTYAKPDQLAIVTRMAYSSIDTQYNSYDCILATRGPYLGAYTNFPQLDAFLWRLNYLVGTSDTGNAGKLKFEWQNAAGVAQEAYSTVALNTVINDFDKVWLKVIFIGDDGGNWTVKFYWSLTDTENYWAPSWTQLGTTVSGGTTSEFEDIDDLNEDYPLFLGGAGGSSGNESDSGDFIYFVMVDESYIPGGATIIRWDASKPYIDYYGATYDVIPRESSGSAWYDPLTSGEPNFDPYNTIAITNGIYAWSYMKVDEGSWIQEDSFYGKQEKDLSVDFQGTRFSLKLKLWNKTLDLTQGRGMTEWRLRSEPIPRPRYLRHYVPVMLYDRMTTIDGHNIGRAGFAQDELALLKTKFRNGDLLDFQPPDHSASVKVRIDELHFKEFAPPRGARGFGGIALLVLREQE